MAGEVVNLNKARKARDKARAAEGAAANRARFGRTNGETAARKAEKALAERRLDGMARADRDDG